MSDKRVDRGFDAALDDEIEAKQLRNSIHAQLFGTAPEPIQIGRFRVLKRVGSGGMGVVYAAYDNELDRKVAVKLLRRDERRDDLWRERLRREAQSLARLSHPNVVQVYESGEHEQQVFIAMEFVEGPNLRQWCADEKPDWRSSLAKMVEAGQGLVAAHKGGIVHRDFKPENVVIGLDGRVRVLDFGLAQPSGDVSEGELKRQAQRPAQTDTRLTRSGLLVGTPAYMSREQFNSEAVDARSDQFSFCVTLYECVYGDRPFEGATVAALEDAVSNNRVREAKNAAVPMWLRRVLLRGLRADPAQRFDSMDELLADLGKDPALTVRRRILGGAALSGLLLTAWTWTHSEETHLRQKDALREERDGERERAKSLEDQTRQRSDLLTVAEVEARIERDPTRALATLRELSPSAEAWGGDARMLAADALERGVAHWVYTPPEGQVPQLLCPGGRWMVTRQPEGGEVHLHDLDRRTSRLLGKTEASVLPSLACSSDGRRLVSAGFGEGLSVYEGERFQDRRQFPGLPSTTATLTFLPGDDAIVASGREGNPQVIDLVTGQRSELPGHQGGLEDLAVGGRSESSVLTADGYGTVRWWMPGESEARILADAQTPFAVSPDGRSVAYSTESQGVALAFVDEEIRVLRGVLEGRRWTLSFSPDGSSLYSGDVDGQLRRWDVSTGEVVDLPAHEAQVQHIGAWQEWLVSTSDDQTLALLDLRTGERRVLRGHLGVASWSFEALEGTYELTTVGWGGQVRRWRLDGFARHLGPPGLPLSGVELTREQVVAFEGARIRRWKHDGTPLAEIGGHLAPIVASWMDLNRGQLYTGDSDGSLRRTTLEGARSLQLLASGAPVLALAVESPSSLAAARDDLDSPLSLLREVDGQLQTRAVDGLEGMTVTALAYAGPELRVVGWDEAGLGRVKAIGADTGVRELGTLGSQGVRSVAFSHDREQVAYSDFLRNVWLWNGEAPRKLGTHAGLVTGASFAPGGAVLATCAEDGSVMFWDLASGRSRSVHLGEQKLSDVAFSPDGKQLFVTGESGVVHRIADDLPYAELALRARLETATP